MPRQGELWKYHDLVPLLSAVPQEQEAELRLQEVPTSCYVSGSWSLGFLSPLAIGVYTFSGTDPRNSPSTMP